jgi:hypothetical protein
MPEDFLRLATTFSRDFRELASMADRLAKQSNPDDAQSIDKALADAAAFVETRCAQGGSTMIFPPSKSIADREKLSDALALMVRRKIEFKPREPED